MMGDRRRPLGIYGRIASKAPQSGVSNLVGSPHNLLHGRIASQDSVCGDVTISQDHVASERDYQRVIWRFALQSAARELLPREGVAHCMRGVIPRPNAPIGVEVLYAPLKHAAHFGGVQMCKSVWLCPVCAAKISERRREELSEALRIWSEEWSSETHRLILVTFTLRHHVKENLQDVLVALRRARRLLTSGRGAQDLAESHGVVGMVRSLEITHGQNGWHPHMHVLMFFDREVRIIPFEQEMKDRWGKCVAAVGRYASWQHGCDVRFSDRDIAEYVAKWGKEPQWTPAHEVTKAVTKAGRKGGRTPLQLLADYLNGDQAAGRLWLQYAVNLKGERQLWWSHKLRERLGLAVEKTDEEIAIEQEEIAVVLASLSAGAWRVVVANDARGELLEVAASGDPEQVQAFLSKLGVGRVLAG